MSESKSELQSEIRSENPSPVFSPDELEAFYLETFRVIVRSFFRECLRLTDEGEGGMRFSVDRDRARNLCTDYEKTMQDQPENLRVFGPEDFELAIRFLESLDGKTATPADRKILLSFHRAAASRELARQSGCCQ